MKPDPDLIPLNKVCTNTAFFSKKLYKIYLERSQGRIRKPSKRQQGIDPVIPLTPAPLKTKARSQQQIPASPQVTFASHQIQASRNRTAAEVLYTPRTKRHHVFRQESPSPTPLQDAPQLISLDSEEVEEAVRGGLARLELEDRSDSQSSDSISVSAELPKVKSRPKGGANDVWKFYEKSSDRHICIICK